MERLEGSYGPAIALAAGVATFLLALGAIALLRFTLLFLVVIPVVLPGIVGILLWQFIYDPNVGLLNSVLQWMGHAEWGHAWLGDYQEGVRLARQTHKPILVEFRCEA